MEKILRRRFVIYSMLLFFIIFIIMFFLINTYTKYSINNLQEKTLENIIDNNGVLKVRPINNKFDILPKDKFRTNDYFSAIIMGNGEIELHNSKEYSHFQGEPIELIDYNLLIDYALEEKVGVIDDYKFLTEAKDGKTIIAFVDISTENFLLDQILFATISSTIMILLCIFLVLSIVSKIVVKPFVDNNTKQKEFITNVSHEFKTPISTIKTNAEVIELLQGESEFSESIHKNVYKLNNLINSLIEYNKNEELLYEKLSDVDLSKIVNTEIDGFSLVHEKLKISIDEGINIKGNEEMLTTLITLLLDNIIKYSIKDSLVEINLYKHKRKVILEFINEAKNLEIKKYDEWFGRFYRQDKARTSNDQNSFGIGLSHASRICEIHKAKISAFSTDGKKITFKIEF